MPSYQDTIDRLRKLFETERDFKALAKKKAEG
jgi:hypothetical protein